MKKVFLFLSVLLVLQQTKAQNMPIPSPNAGNVLFLKFSFSLNSSRGYFIDDVSISPQGNRDFKPVYPYLGHNVSDASGSMMMNFFYVPNPDEFAYIDPAIYNSVSISRVQLIDILKTKTISGGKEYLNGFSRIYLIDYEQKNPNNPNQVKILKVKPHYNFFKY
jgi:hypothetical protein